jgi:uroporphyrinogen-III decarboxylase
VRTAALDLPAGNDRWFDVRADADRGLIFALSERAVDVIDVTVPLSILPRDRIVMGNIDPVRTLKMATPEVLHANILELLAKTKQYPNHVLSTGCDSPPGVPMENVNTFYEALAEFNKGKQH